MTVSDAIDRFAWLIASEEVDDPRIGEALAALRKPAPRGSGAYTDAMRARPSRLAEMAAFFQFRQGDKVKPVADAICAIAEKYRRTRWQRDRMHAGKPDDLAETPEEQVYLILRDLGSFPANSTVRAELSNWFNK